VGEYLRSHLLPVLRYADYLKEEISHNVLDFDRVMKWGFGWEMGPFEMIDAIGHERLSIPEGDFYKEGTIRSFGGGYVAAPDEPKYRVLASFPILQEEETYRLRDLGDGVVAVCTKTKMGTITPALVDQLTKLMQTSIDNFVLTSEAKSFSAGYDLNFFAAAIDAADFTGIDMRLGELHRLGELLERKRCVAAVYGHCLGAGLELALGCGTIAAHPETAIGLPEAKVGLIPGGRGTVLMRLYNQFTAKRLSEVAVNLMVGAVSVGAEHARILGYLRPSDVTVFHPDKVLVEAKRLVQIQKTWTRPPFLKPEGPITGMIDHAQAEASARDRLTDYDKVLGDKIKAVFAKSVSYDDALAIERREFLDLCGRALTHTRIRHMLETNKPLKN
jgi:3-hydroxyacyl-CoA dehydrogenase